MSTPNLNDRLKRFGPLIASRPSGKVHSHPSRYDKLAQAVGGELRSDPGGVWCLVRTHYPASYRHGSWKLGALIADTELPLSAFTATDEPGRIDRADLLFLDTETTGLGGTGTVPFLVGVASVDQNGIEIRQYLVPDYPDEAAMLEAVLQELTADRVLVTYNGAAFDIPLLRDRFIINRVAREITPAGHLDLLHPTRRLFKRRLKDCALTNIERELFGLFRENDVPGYLIPSIYFDWLSSEETGQLQAVLEHNRMDILSLYFLAAKISRVFMTDGEVLKEGDDLYSLSRVYRRRSHYDKAVRLCERIEEESKAVAQDVLLFHAQTLKKVADWARAVRAWESLAIMDSKEGYWANIELAKYFEHREADLTRALVHARRASVICPYSRSEKDRLQARISRLSSKLEPPSSRCPKR